MGQSVDQHQHRGYLVVRCGDERRECDERHHAQRRYPVSTGRAVILTATLALGLAWLTYRQTDVWGSDGALWTSAHAAASQMPRPWIALARVAWRDGDLATAETRLARARATVARQDPLERAWALDQITAITVGIRLQQGRVREAGALMRGSTPSYETWVLCQHYAAICALAPE
jgi:ATP/maltotriose-dependent transcriptional regulator MalT